MSYDIYGLGSVPTEYKYDYTNPSVTLEYKTNMDTLWRIFSKTGPMTEEDVAEMQKAMKALHKLAQEGNDGGNPNGPKYMTTGMLHSVSVVTQALALQGIQPPDFNATPAQLEKAKTAPIGVGTDGKYITLADYIAQVSTTETINSNKSVIAMMEMEFIPETFKMFAAILGGLDSQISTNSEVLYQLNIVYRVLNMVKAPDVGGFKVIPQSNADIPPEIVKDLADYMNKIYPDKKDNNGNVTEKGWGTLFQEAWDKGDPEAYKYVALFMEADPNTTDKTKSPYYDIKAMGYVDSKGNAKSITGDKDGKRASYVVENIYSKHFDQLKPIPVPTENAANELLAARDELEKLLNELEAQKRASESPPNPIAPRDRVNTPEYYLNLVIQDIDEAFKGVDRNDKVAMDTAVKKWIMDNQDQGSGNTSRGKTGANIASAIDAFKDMNDKLNAKFKQEYERFSEFIKMATMFLESVYKSMSNISQGIK